ncbi:MAG: hypothetical protein JWP64_4835 [Pseudonocardia sp.]|nr:hypothetical protein [Pseudonocardia sp.]
MARQARPAGRIADEAGAVVARGPIPGMGRDRSPGSVGSHKSARGPSVPFVRAVPAPAAVAWVTLGGDPTPPPKR